MCFYIDIKHNIRYDYCVTHSRLGGGRHHHAHWRITETDAAGLPPARSPVRCSYPAVICAVPIAIIRVWCCRSKAKGRKYRKRRYFPFWNGGKESWTVSASPAGNRRSSRSCRSFSKSFAVLAMPSSWTPTAPTPPCSRRFCMSAFLTMWRWTLRTALLVMRKPAAASTAFPGCGRAPPC